MATLAGDINSTNWLVFVGLSVCEMAQSAPFNIQFVIGGSLHNNKIHKTQNIQ